MHCIIVRFEKYILCFEKPIYKLPHSNGMMAYTHTLTYWPNVGAFGSSVPQPHNQTSLRKLQDTSAYTSIAHTTGGARNLKKKCMQPKIVAYAT